MIDMIELTSTPGEPSQEGEKEKKGEGEKKIEKKTEKKREIKEKLKNLVKGYLQEVMKKEKKLALDTDDAALEGLQVTRKLTIITLVTHIDRCSVIPTPIGSLKLLRSTNS